MDVTSYSMLLLVAVLGLGVLGAVGTAWFARQQRQTVWQKFAVLNGLHLSVETETPYVVGVLDGRNVELTLSAESSDNELGVQGVTMSVSLHHPPETRICVHKFDALVSHMERAADPNVLTTGNPEFDDQVILVSESPGRCQQWLNRTRQRVLQQAVAAHGDSTLCIEGGRLILEDRELLPQLDELRARLSVLQRTAEQLDAADHPSVENITHSPANPPSE